MSDSAIVDGFLTGDKAATAHIEAYIQAAYRRWQGKFGYEADDIRSDILYKLLTSFRRGDFAFRANLRTYINRVVNHTCIDYWRFHRRIRVENLDELDIPISALTAEENLERQQAARLVFRVLRLVPRECLRLWRMQLKNDLTCRRIGKLLGKSEGNIRRQLWACRQAAKKIRENLTKKDKLS